LLALLQKPIKIFISLQSVKYLSQYKKEKKVFYFFYLFIYFHNSCNHVQLCRSYPTKAKKLGLANCNCSFLGGMLVLSCLSGELFKQQKFQDAKKVNF
jgi:hypothetical protein